jgi:Tat protein secretion system quality control protein TatD with DNase activity
MPNERNEPKHIIVAVEKIAELKNIHLQSVLEAVGENTRKLYGNL